MAPANLWQHYHSALWHRLLSILHKWGGSNYVKSKRPTLLSYGTRIYLNIINNFDWRTITLIGSYLLH